MNASGRFTWLGRQSPDRGILPGEAGEEGEIRVRFGIDPSLSATWDGVLSLRFTDTGTPWSDFVYRIVQDSLVLSPARVDPEELLVRPKDLSPSAIRFSIRRD